MGPFRLLALGAALFGIGLTSQQFTLSWQMAHTSSTLSPAIDRLDRTKAEGLVELRQHLETLEDWEAAEALEEIETTFGRRDIKTRTAVAKGVAGAAASDVRLKRFAPLLMLLQVGGAALFLLCILKILRTPRPSLPAQVCSVGLAGLLVFMAMLDQSGLSVVQSASEQAGLSPDEVLPELRAEPSRTAPRRR